VAAWNEAPAAGGLGECAALVRSAEALRFSAPELAVQLARRALLIGAAEPADSGDVGQVRALSMRAQAVLAAGLVRISHYVDAVEPAFAALVLAEDDGLDHVAMSVRLDLASCSREVGEPLLGAALLRPVLETGRPQPALRAAALGRLVGCIAHVGRRDDIEDALTEADRLLAADDGLSPDARRIERARLSVRAAAYHRWYGDTEDAAEAAREGLTQLNRLRGLRSETGRLRAQLVLELVCALLDEGSLAEAASVSDAVLAEPVRATSAAAVGQLMLAVSTRVHLPSGRVDRGRGLLDQAVWVADRHGLDGLLADVLTASSLLDEDAGRPAEALESLHGARAAEQRRLHAIARAGRRVLTEVGARDWDVNAVNAMLRQVVRATGHPATAGATASEVDARSSRPETQASPPERDHAEPAARATGQHADPLSAQERAWTEARRTPPAERHRASHPGSSGERSHDAYRHSAPEEQGRPAAARTEPARQSAADQEAPSAGEPAPWLAREPATAEPSAGELVSAAAADRANAQTDTDEATGLLNKEGLFRRLHSVRNGERPVALTLVRLENNARRDAGPDTAADNELSELAGRVRNIAPDDAELARAGGAELAVLLPHTTHDQAERFAAAIESAWQGTSHGHGISTGVVQSNPDAPAVDARALLTAARHALTPAAPARDDEQRYPRTVEELAALQDTDNTLRIGRDIIRSLSIPEGSGGKRRAGADDAAPPTDSDTDTGHAATTPSGGSASTPTDTERDTYRNAWPATAEADMPAGDPTDGHRGASTDDSTGTRAARSVGAESPLSATGPSNSDEAGAGFLQSPAGVPGGSATEPAAASGDREPVDADRAPEIRFTGSPGDALTEERTGESAVGEGFSSAGSGERMTGSVDDRSIGAWPLAGVSGDGSSITAGDAAPDRFDAGPTEGGYATTAEPAGASGGRLVRAEGPPRHDTAGGPSQTDYGSSMYEQTKADLARMMSALHKGNLRIPPAGRSSYESAPLPAPARPGDDHPRNGATLPRQSIPTPPDPDEVPEPPTRPDVPDPHEPDPIPPVPPDPGPSPPDEPGPLTPPSVEWPGAGRWDVPSRSWPAPADSARFGQSDAAPPDRPAGYDADTAARAAVDNPATGGAQARESGTTAGDPGRPGPASDTPSDVTSPPASGQWGSTTSTPVDAPSGAWGASPGGGMGSASASGPGSTAGAPDDASTSRPGNPSASGHWGAAAGRPGAAPASGPGSPSPGGPWGAAQGAREDATGGRPAGPSASGPGAAGSAPVEALGSGPGGVAASGPDGATADEPGVRRGRRSERSSTTIAGLLAEALAAYQETTDEPDKSAQSTQPVRPAEPDNDFDRLFDWRYQSPASGRHRSPE
jgi:GGDEF domain-containing protein